MMSCFFAGAQSQKENGLTGPVDYVNSLMGTDSKPALSNGNTYPAIGVPWGMNMWTPQTGKNGDGWQYTYAADRIAGFKQTHQPSPWMNDYGMFSIMPVTGKVKFDEKERASWFSHKTETATPYYYSVYLADADVTTEITPTERAAQFRFTFPQTDNAYLVVDAFDRGSSVKIDASGKKITGYSSRYARGKLVNFKSYFVIYFDKPISSAQTVGAGGSLLDATEATADHALAVIGFKTRKGEQVHCRVASSYISSEQAELNLQRELAGDDFEATKTKARASWNQVLGRAAAEGGTEEQLKTFYSCLYRAVMFPNKGYEIDAANKIVHYSPYNGKVLPGYMFAGTGFWDTFRALYPLLNLLYPSINKEMQEGLINDYKEGGWLPEWSSPGYADIMVGNNSASVVAEAYIKGLRGYDIQTLYEALVHGANNEGPMSAVGRKGVAYYNSLGYVPYDVKINENAARTLEYAYDDFAIYQLAKALNRPKEEIALYAKRCQNYRNLFDKTHNLMRGKNKDGSFQSPFSPVKWGDAFTEGNSWHYSWSVFHDVQGLIDLMGGASVFSGMLDSVFASPPVFDDSYYGGTIHEIREMQIAGMGQYAHGNQPIQHMIYLYNYAGQPWKTQYWAREAMNRLYRPTPDGYCGDEDNGQTSAWYVFSAMGFYPVCPVSDQYVLGAPLFKKMTLNLENGRTFVIQAPANDDQKRYVSSIAWNGEPYSKTWLSHTRLLSGGSLSVEMTATPVTGRRIAREDLPWSFSAEVDKGGGNSEMNSKREARRYGWNDRANNPVFRSDSTTQKGYTLIFLVQDSSFSTVTQQRLTDAFFAVYPAEAARFNPAAMKKVVFIIDPSYKGVAATSNGTVRCNPQWLKTHPEDIDVMTHEVMHVVQAYHKGNTPGWLTEGIADYVRYKYGINNEKSGWSLAPWRAGQRYTDAYRITARFLVWVEENADKQIIDKMNKAAFDGVYEEGLWVKYTGKTVDDLWKMYVQAQQAVK